MAAGAGPAWRDRRYVVTRKGERVTNTPVSFKFRLSLPNIIFSVIAVAPTLAKAQDKPYFITYLKTLSEQPQNAAPRNPRLR